MRQLLAQLAKAAAVTAEGLAAPRKMGPFGHFATSLRHSSTLPGVKWMTPGTPIFFRVLWR
jgi:hypothetical protein